MNGATLYASVAAALPEVVLAAGVCAVLLVDLFLKAGQRHLTYWLTIALLVAVGAICVLDAGRPAGFAFGGMYVTDLFSHVLKAAILFAAAATLVYSRPYLEARGLLSGEFLALALFATLGMLVMVSSHHFLTLYLGLELQALSLYAMVALQRDSVRASEAAMKYFVLGALASGLLLYGLSMIYGATGSLDLAQVSRAVVSANSNPTLLAFGLVFVVSGVAFKLGVVPFHMWIPDVYHGAATPVTLFIGAAPKVAAFAFTLRLLAGGLQGMVADWAPMLAILAVLSLLLGNVVAIAQGNLKRMLAYSTISHMGFLVLGIMAGNDNGYSSAMFYVLAYLLMTLAAFGVMLLLTRAGFEAEELDDWKGLNQRSGWFAFMMLIVMFSLAGLPPTIGFFAKLSVLQAALEAGWLWLVVFAVVMSVIGAFYYLRIVKLMYMDDPVGEYPLEPRQDARWLLSANGIAILALGILPAPLMDLCARAIFASM